MKGLKLGNVASVMGKVIYNYEDNSLRIENPLIICDNIISYKSYLKNLITISKVKIVISLFITYLLVHALNS